MRMTQAELAEGIISVPYLSLIENEKAMPRADVLEPLAQRLNCSVNNLLGVTDQETLRRAEGWIDQVRLALTYEGVGEAERIFQSLKELSFSIANPKILMQVDLVEIQLLIHRLELEESRTRLEMFKEQWPQLSDEYNLLAWYLRLQGNLYFYQDQHHKALIYYREAERILSSVTDDIEKAYIFGNLGRTYLHLSNSSLGILYTEKCIEIMQRKDRWLETCTMLNILGACHTRRGEHKDAIECFERVLRMADRFSVTETLTSQTYHELGICYFSLSDYDRSIQYLLKSLDVVKKEQLSRWEIGYTHKIICQNYIKKGDFEQARHHLELAMDHLQKRKQRLTDCYILLGQIHYAQGDISSFVQCYEKAIREYGRLGISEKAAQASRTLGKYMNDTGDRNQALSYLLQAVEHYQTLASSIDFPVELPPTPGDQPKDTASPQ
ncbi:tetratricopeptide repeat protein [Desmospora activa DSM 45169]|uniref:Tetratricopeptide repeat protein n=1 Tax=Desmospora activa DSM 45169 TaxID=1121389 RepID=A0A2T4Z6I6_9BACL|nr:tetratricopeptide repeat protein [Desmospora activa DSM 45169]